MVAAIRTIEQIDDYIVQRAKLGTRPADIATDVGLSSAFVRDRAGVLGIAFEDGSHVNKYRVDPMWNADPDQLRHWIWKRQHDGARDTLRRLAHA